MTPPAPAVIFGWKAIAAKIGRSPRWCLYWVKSKRLPALPLSWLNGRVSAEAADLETWVRELRRWTRENPTRLTRKRTQRIAKVRRKTGVA